MSVQNIRTDQDDLFLLYLDNGQDARLFPPMRIEEDANFLKVWGRDNKIISISKVGFEVIINGTTYNDVEQATAQIAVEIGKIVTRYSGGGGGGVDDVNLVSDGVGINKEATQLLVLAEAEEINSNLQAPQIFTYFDLAVSLGTPWPGFPFTVNQIDWNDGTTAVGGAITPTLVNNLAELVALFNSTIPNNQLEERSGTTVYLKPGTEGVPTAGGAFVNIQTTTPDILFYPKGNWATEPEPNPSSPKISAEKLCNIVDGQDTTPTITTLLYPGGGTMNNSITMSAANANRNKIAITITGADAWIKKQVSGGSVREGILVKAGGTYFDSRDSAGYIYRGEWSIINVANGETPTFNVTEE